MLICHLRVKIRGLELLGFNYCYYMYSSLFAHDSFCLQRIEGNYIFDVLLPILKLLLLKEKNTQESQLKLVP